MEFILLNLHKIWAYTDEKTLMKCLYNWAQKWPNFNYLWTPATSGLMVQSIRSALSNLVAIRHMWRLRPCIPNFLPNFRVGFRVGTNIFEFPKFEKYIIFSKFSESSKFPNFRNFRTFGKTSFRNYRTFFRNYRTFSELFPNFLPNFSELFDRKTG